MLDHFALTPGYTAMLLRFLLNTLATWVIVDRLYFRKSRRRDFFFTFMLLGVAIFMLVFFMVFVLEDLKTKTGIGIGIGLFGIFSIMRYRTDTVPVREMSYLFVIISLSVINAIAGNTGALELILTNLIVIAFVWVLERSLKQLPSKLVQYDRLDLTHPDRRQELIDDLEQRLGLDIDHVDVGGIDMLRDMALIRVYYHARKADQPLNDKTKLKTEDYDESQKA